MSALSSDPEIDSTMRNLNVLRERIQEVKEQVDVVFAQQQEKGSLLSDSPESRAEFNLSMAYTLPALYFLLLNIMGKDPKSHDVDGELKRVKRYLQNFHKVMAQVKGASGGETQSRPITGRKRTKEQG